MDPAIRATRQTYGFTLWTPEGLRDVVEGAGLSVERLRSEDDGWLQLVARASRAR